MGEYIINRIFNSITYILPTGNDKDCWLADCGDVEDFVLAHPENVRMIEDYLSPQQQAAGRRITRKAAAA